MKDRLKIKGPYLASARYLMICGAGLLAFFFMGILPNHLAMKKLDTTIASLKNQLADQEALFPIYNEMMSKLQKKAKSALPLPAPEALAKGDTERPGSDIKELAARYRLRLNGITPDLDNLVNGGGDSLRLKATLRGAFADLQPLLMEVGKLAYVESIEELRISAMEGERELFVQFTVRQKK